MGALACLCALLLSAPIAAQRAWIVSDAKSGAVFAAHNANAPSYPASLTKLMTAFITLQKVEAGELELTQKVVVSKHAAAQPAIDMGLAAGASMTIEQALLGTIVRSANDAAMVLAEAVGGSEAEFINLMNFTAADLGMRSSRFHNPSGLPHAEQVTTARDMTLLVLALQYSLPKHYSLFGKRSFRYKGRTIKGHNAFLGSYKGSDGLKTGFTCRAGFSLAASAQRGERRVIGVLLGAKSGGQRAAKMRSLFDAAFNSGRADSAKFTLQSIAWAPDQGSDLAPNGKIIAGRCNRRPGELAYMQARNWSLEFAVARDWQAAVSAANRVLHKQRKKLRGARPLIIPRIARDLVYRVGLTGMARKTATEVCLELRKTRNFCVVMAPATAEQALRQGRRALKAKRNNKS